MENHHFSRVNTLFLWPSSIAFCQRLPEGIHLNAAAGAQKKSRIKVLKCPFAALGAKRNSGQNMPESGGTANSSQKIKKKIRSALLIAIFWSPSSGPFWAHLFGVTWRSHGPMIPMASGSWPQYRNKLKRKHSWHPMDHRKTTTPRGNHRVVRCGVAAKRASLVESSTWPAAFSSLEAGGC